jgi:hypothetical protein
VAVLSAAHRLPEIVHDERQVGLRRREVCVAEGVLHVPQVGPGPEHVGAEVWRRAWAEMPSRRYRLIPASLIQFETSPEIVSPARPSHSRR